MVECRVAEEVRVLIADDHAPVRQGVRALLSIEQGVTVVGEAADGQQAVALVAALVPDVVLMDVRMPVMDGIESARRIKRISPATCIVMLTTHDDPRYMLESLRAGASGFVLKESGSSALAETIRAIADGEPVLDPRLTSRLLTELLTESSDPSPAHHSAIPSLSNQELAVLRLLSSGFANPRIADALGISLGTVKAHVRHIISKLGVSDRTQAAVRALELGLITTHEPPPA